MGGRPDKQARKAMLGEWRAKHRAAARAKFPLPDEQMMAMFDMLNVELPKQGCDHSLRLVRAWAQKLALPFDQIRDWFDENGGFCDCEVLANCEQQWREANHDVAW
jgi:hypothetical protein